VPSCDGTALRATAHHQRYPVEESPLFGMLDYRAHKDDISRIAKPERISSSRLQKNYERGRQGTYDATYQELGHCITFRTLPSSGNLNRAEMFKRDGATYNHGACMRLVNSGFVVRGGTRPTGLNSKPSDHSAARCPHLVRCGREMVGTGEAINRCC
jgi:hypothetical protein